MHQQEIIDSIMQKLNTTNCDVKVISLMTDVACLQERLMADVKKGIRNADVIERSTERIPLYQKLDSIKIDTSVQSVRGNNEADCPPSGTADFGGSPSSASNEQHPHPGPSFL